MKVLILNSCVSGGGAGRSLENYFKHIDPMIEAHVVLPERGVISETLDQKATLWFVPEFVERIHQSTLKLPRLIDSGYVHIVINFFWTLPRSAKKIIDIAQKIQPDIIYCNHMLANPVGALVGWWLGIPVIFHARNIHVAWFGRKFYTWLAKLNIVKMIICNSKASAELFLEHVPQKVRIVHNFLDLEKFDPHKVEGVLRTSRGLNRQAVLVGYIGRILPKKGIDVLIQAFKKVYDACPDLYLVIIGGNDGGLKVDLQAKYWDEVKTLGISDRVIFTGFQKDIRPWMKDLDVVILPSVEPESFGRVLIEGMAFGIPCISTALGGAVEVVKHGENGMLIPPRDVNALAEALNVLYVQSDFRKTLGARGQKMVHAEFAARTLAHQITEVFLEIGAGDIYRAVAS